VATVTDGGEVGLWDRRSVDRPRAIGEPGGFTDVAFSPDGSRLATVNSFGSVALWDPVSGAQLAAAGDPGFTLAAVTFTADGSRVAVASRALFPAPGRPGSSVSLLAVPDLTTVADYPTGDADPTRVAASPDGRQLAAPLSDGRVAVFGTDGTPPVLLPGHAKLALTAEFTPDGRTLATGGDDTRVRLWSMPDGRPAGEIDTGQQVRALAFDANGTSLAVAAQVQQLRLWQLPDRQLLANLDRVDDVVNDLVFDGDGNLVVGLANGSLEFSDLDPDRAVRSLCDRLDVATVDAAWRDLGPDLGPAPSCPS
jgi:WD40 repeat protein